MKMLLALLSLFAIFGAIYLLSNDKRSPSELGLESRQLTEEILAYGPRPPGSKGLANVQQHLSKILTKAGWKVQFQTFERDTPLGKIKFSNLRARLPVDNADPWSRKVKGILCAHIDSKYYADKVFLGADDAASACAAVVRIAVHLTEHKLQQAEQLEIVLFDGEEAFEENMTIIDGLYGSRYYANVMRGNPDKPEFGILLDMIGHEDLRIRIPSDSPPKLANLMFETAEDQEVSNYFGTAPGPIMDDHLPLNMIGIPTIDIIGDFANKPWWHTSGDNISIISEESLSITISVTLGMLENLLKEP